MTNKFTLKSNSFENGGNIPKEFTCDGKNISPQLSWENVPANTKSLVLIVDDPDAQAVVGKTFVHWIVNGIPPEIKQLPENIIIKDEVPEAREVENDFGNKGYGGPCPPDKEHTYHFTLFALNQFSELNVKITSELFRNLLKEFITGEAQLIGKYKRTSS